MNSPHQAPPPGRRRAEATRPARPPRRGGRAGSPDGSEPPSATRPSTRRTRTAPRSRAVSGAPTPATVWACGPRPVDPEAVWPTPIVKKIVTSFTSTGGRVVLLTDPSTAAITDKPSTPTPESNPHSEPDTEVEAALTAIRDLDRTARVFPLTSTPAAHAPASRPYWADLVDGPQGLDDIEPTTPSGAVPDDLGDRAAGADVVIASLRPAHSGEAVSDHLARAAARLLRTGGILAMLTHSDNSQGKLVDPTGPVVAACQNADLLYLQHIVVLLAPIRDGRFVLTPDTTAATGTGRSQPHADDHQGPAPHRRIHADLVVFAQPHEYRSPSLSPADAVRETGVIR